MPQKRKFKSAFAPQGQYQDIDHNLFEDRFKRIKSPRMIEVPVKTKKGQWGVTGQTKPWPMAPGGLNELIREDDELARLTGGIGPDYDYSYAESGPDGRAHYTDRGKLPTHPTYSDESAYADRVPFEPGHWGRTPAGEDYFAPSEDKMRSTVDGVPYEQFIERYMNEVEPGVRLIKPYIPLDEETVRAFRQILNEPGLIDNSMMFAGSGFLGGGKEYIRNMLRRGAANEGLRMLEKAYRRDANPEPAWSRVAQ